MEWECVYYLTHVPSGRKMQEWEKECETNLLYVAATRSKHELVLAPLPVKTKAKKA
jgi:ATP-dependent exoDNAse (exonuclease V) beta subunit